MVVCRPSSLIEVRRVNNRGRGGRGVFAVVDIPVDTVIERAPLIVIPENQVFGDGPVATNAAKISWYVFGWNETKQKSVVLALGCGSIYNHSPHANAAYFSDPPDVMEFIATRDIAAGEEIFINYQGEDGDEHPIGFKVYGAKK